MFNVTHMRNGEGRNSYIRCLYTFVNAFHRETDVKHLLEKESISQGEKWPFLVVSQVFSQKVTKPD